MINQIVILTNSDLFRLIDKSNDWFWAGKRGGRLREQVGYATGSVQSFFLHCFSIIGDILPEHFDTRPSLFWSDSSAQIFCIFFALTLSLISTRRPSRTDQRHQAFQVIRGQHFSSPPQDTTGSPREEEEEEEAKKQKLDLLYCNKSPGHYEIKPQLGSTGLDQIDHLSRSARSACRRRTRVVFPR